MKLAAIDIGSNSIHLVIAQANQGQNLEIIDREKEMVRLGAGTLRLHRLSEDTIDRAICVLRRYRKMAEANRVDVSLTTATAAVRESDNADEFIERVRREVGLDVQLLPGVEEARLIALAVSQVTDMGARRALIVDVGGGSTEFIVTRGGQPELLLSVRLGAVRLTEKFITTDPISHEERERLVASIRADLVRAVREISDVGYDFVIGTSGTVLNLTDAIVREEMDGKVEGFESFGQTITLDQLRRFNCRLAQMTVRERSRIPGIEPARADIIVAGGLLLETIMAEIGANSITSCDWSLREGIILDYLHKHAYRGAKMDADVRTRSVMSVARRYDYDAPHSQLVARLATRIFDDTCELHGMGRDERKLLEYAALLHDIGYHIAHNNHHRHALYLIKNSEMPGFTGNELAVMATVVRYHRGSMPQRLRDARSRREHEDLLALDRTHRRVALQLAAILQVADGLDRSHRQLIEDVRCEVSDGCATFHIKSTGECDLEIWSAERKAIWFSRLFRVQVRFECER
jgi:exopolyphosphatase/guanosine-5'-triphosphate,3'-diphosphate pyrophosphatase